jgi:hypothetical protein
MRSLAPAFTAVLTLGFAACIHGRPYVGPESRVFVMIGLLIGAGFAAGSVRTAAALAAWWFLFVFIIGALTDIPQGLCFCDRGPPPPEHFPALIITLFIGSLGVHLLARRPPPIQIVRARTLARRRPRSGH